MGEFMLTEDTVGTVVLINNTVVKVSKYEYEMPVKLNQSEKSTDVCQQCGNIFLELKQHMNKNHEGAETNTRSTEFCQRCDKNIFDSNQHMNSDHKKVFTDVLK